MFRLLYLTFHGRFRGSEEQHHHLHESPAVMTVPLIVLAAGAICSGWVGLPPLGGLDFHWLNGFLAPVIAHVGEHAEHHASVPLELALIGISVLVAVAGILAARHLWGGDRGLQAEDAFAQRFGGLRRLLANKYWVDEIYDATIIRGTWASGRGLFAFDSRFIDGVLVDGSRHLTVAISLLSGFFDKYFVDGLVNLTGLTMRLCSRSFRSLQTGAVSQYGLVMALGVVILLGFYLAMRLAGWGL
jgi:NADH-quinone oxidoreductase subunit L